jgi:hypothetical protein
MVNYVLAEALKLTSPSGMPVNTKPCRVGQPSSLARAGWPSKDKQ